ncbi:MAG: nitroreductase/quinone reductase family protein [Acidimicrobiales bacterium]
MAISTSSTIADRTIDITTTGRRTGESRRIEIVFYRLGDDIYLSGIPGPRTRDWLANLASQPQFTFHLKRGVIADLTATATVIVDPQERRRVLTVFVEEFNRRNGPHSAWPEAVLEEWVARSPLRRNLDWYAVTYPSLASQPTTVGVHNLVGKIATHGDVAKNMLVEIWSDIVCPWCYIGKRRFEAALAVFEHADEVEVRWKSFELDPRAPALRSGSMADHLAAKYGISLQEAADRLAGMNRLAAEDGLRYNLVKTRSGNTFAAHRLIHLANEAGLATGAALKERLLHAYFEEFQPVGDPKALIEMAVAVGLDRGEVKSTLDSDRFADEVRRDEAEASALGCTGVPFFVIDRRFAVPGAQDAETFLISLQRAWARSSTQVRTSTGDAGFCADDAAPI